MEKQISGLFIYDGSKILEPLTGPIGLPIDQVNFLACQFIALVLGYFYRTKLGPQNASPTQRHLVQVFLGLAITYFCYGSQILHLFAQTFVCYILMCTLKPGLMEKVVFSVAMGYLATCHIYRVMYDYGGYTLDITGPLMINTQRLACLAFSLRDGSVKDESKLTPIMKYHATKKWPSFLEFTSYTMCFSTVICGPLCFYRDYIRFIEGTNYDLEKKDDDSSGATIKQEAVSPVMALCKAMGWTILSGTIMMVVLPVYPVQYMMTDDFFKMSFIQKHIYMMLCTTLMRFKYYFAWMLGEVVNLSSGLGYNGVDKDGNHQWDLLNNAGITKVELSTSLKILLDNWNKTTTYWLRYVVYERIHNTIAVFFVSAFWHGFYIGYYITFMFGAIFIHVSRIVRRKIRPQFQTSPVGVAFYDAVTFLGTRLAIAYLVYPFVLMEFWPTWKIYGSLYYWYHLLVALGMLFLPMMKTPRPPASAAAASSSVSPSSEDAKKTQ